MKTRRAAGRLAFALVALAACSAPEYKFASSSSGASGSPTPLGRDSGTSIGDDDDSGSSSGGTPDGGVTDASPNTDAMALATTAMPATADLAADCTAYAVPDMNQGFLTDGASTGHCVMFFHNATWHRTWSEANAMCTQITRAGKSGHLAVFLDQAIMTSFVTSGKFTASIAAWVGLKLTPGAPANDKANWTWVTGQPATFDGWAAGRPGGNPCVSWAGTDADQNPHWTDVDCALAKGVLCEMDP